MKGSRAVTRVLLVAMMFAACLVSYLYRVHKWSLNERLAVAVNREDPAVVRSLLARGADPNGRGADGRQVLESLHAGPGALTPEKLEIARMLVRAGVEPVTSVYFPTSTDTPPEKYEESHLYKFASMGDIEMMRIMLQRARKSSPALTHGSAILNADDSVILDAAVSAGQLPMLKFLLSAGLKPNRSSTGFHRYSPLVTAAGHGWVEGVDLLLQFGANPNMPEEPSGHTPLMAAVWGGFSEHTERTRQLEIMRRLVAHGASIAQENEHLGQTVLDFATETGNRAAVTFLLDHAADVNHRDFGGFTALAEAAGRGNRPLVKLLLARGADPKVRVRAGNGAPISLTEFAIQRHHPEIVPLLLRAP